MKKIIIYIIFLLLTKDLYFVEIEDLESEKTGIFELVENDFQEDSVVAATSNLHYQSYVKTQKEKLEKNKKYKKEDVITESVEIKPAPVCALTPVNDLDVYELKKKEE